MQDDHVTCGGTLEGLAPFNPETATDLSDGARMFANRILKKYRHFRKVCRREGVSCYRLYDADMKEYNLAVEVFEGEWLVVSEYAPPKTVDPHKAEQRLQEAVSVLPRCLGLPSEKVFLRRRERQRGKEQYQPLEQEGLFHEVGEGGHRFWVNFTDYLDTGLFLDHRITRRLIEEKAEGKAFLNLFAYTGTATVYAAAGGARSTLTVDASSTYLDWARRNLELNGFSGDRHRLLRANCLTWLPGASERFDLIFLDPPTFSNQRSTGTVFSVQEDHGWLIHQAMRLLRHDGELIFSCNFRKFELDSDLKRDFGVEDLTQKTLPFDFEKNPRIHVCYALKHL